MAIFNGTFNGVDTQFRCHSDLPRHGCIDISTPPPRHFGVWMDAWTDLRLKVCSQEIASWRAPCGLSHDWETQKKRSWWNMMDIVWRIWRSNIYRIPFAHVTFRITKTRLVLYHQLRRPRLIPSLFHQTFLWTHGPTKIGHVWVMLLYTRPSTLVGMAEIAMPWKLPVTGCMILIHQLKWVFPNMGYPRSSISRWDFP